MTVLDSYAVLAYLKAEAAAGEVRPLILAGDARLTAVGVGEVIDHLVRVVKADEDEASLDLAQLDLLDAIPVGPDIGAAAGRLRGLHYHSIRRAVSMADCIAAEAARHLDEPLATADPDLLDMCHAERIACAVLPQSTGARWRPPG